MSFISIPYFLLFLIVATISLIYRNRRGSNVVLLLASYVFYGWWDYRFLSLIIFSSLMDFWCGIFLGNNPKNLGKDHKRICVLCLSIISNLGLLFFFKYFNFFGSSLNGVLTTLGFEPAAPVLNIILPVGISFYTFQTMSYTIDVYQGKQKACRQLIDFMLYVSFFPQLVAGPIERAGHILPQLKKKKQFNPERIHSGLRLMFWGYLKKIVIANNMAVIVDHYFYTSNLSALMALLCSYAFYIQIYADFSAYTDIAIGSARVLGIDLRKNFRQPFLSTDPQDFWRRWHISLSTWLRDYLYIPLGGSRKGNIRTGINLMITMALGGLWHGASLTFIIWGIFHGSLLIGYRFLKKEKGINDNESRRKGTAGRIISILIFFHISCFGWIIFRSESLVWCMKYLNAFLNWSSHDLVAFHVFQVLGSLSSIFIIHCIKEKYDISEFINSIPKRFNIPVYISGYYLAVFCGQFEKMFIYFRF